MTENTKSADKTAEEIAALKNKARANAEKLLREKYAEEFKALVQTEATKLGVVYSFRKTKEEKAREQYEALVAEFPHLAQQGEA